ncbi:MAG: hypothetical protein H6853_06460 [Rhodospirillales bacterium]|nr:hypothetical protein [Alphaproteobacteria bacterium]USO03174.1 MAG: hypothetical protein H6853_06460 [Rhodospirillales bacterium]
MSDNTKNYMTDMPDRETSHEVMKLVLDHYIKHHSVVLKKLQIAQEATAKNLEEIRGISGRLGAEEKDSPLDDARKYDDLWGSIISAFEEHGISEEDMKRIEDILLVIPRQIKVHYERIMEEDKALCRLIEKLNSPEYKKAYDIVKQVQAKENPMSHLGPEEYEDVPEEDVFSYKITRRS